VPLFLPKEQTMQVFVTRATTFSDSALTFSAVTATCWQRPWPSWQARYEALFVSELQPTDAPTAGMVAEAIERTLRRFGVRGCAGRMAQEFGDHPDTAVTRMRWARHLARAAARPQARASTAAGVGAEPPGRPAERAALPPNAVRPCGSPCRTDVPPLHHL
jgi:hypothetical protein